MDTIIAILRFIHLAGVVAMAWPLYALVTVNERGRLGPPLGDRADVYMENIIRGMAVRCYAFQITVLGSGLLLIWVRGLGLGARSWPGTRGGAELAVADTAMRFIVANT